MSSDQADQAAAEERPKFGRAWKGRLVALIAMCVLILALVLAFDGDNEEGPEPGSPAAQYCDTNDRGPGTVQYGGKSYDSECLDAYPRTK